MHIQRAEKTYLYLLKVTNFRSTVEYRLYRALPLDVLLSNLGTDTIRQPFEDEFSRAEINLFLSYLCRGPDGAPSSGVH